MNPKPSNANNLLLFLLHNPLLAVQAVGQLHADDDFGGHKGELTRDAFLLQQYLLMTFVYCLSSTPHSQ